MKWRQPLQNFEKHFQQFTVLSKQTSLFRVKNKSYCLWLRGLTLKIRLKPSYKPLVLKMDVSSVELSQKLCRKLILKVRYTPRRNLSLNLRRGCQIFAMEAMQALLFSRRACQSGSLRCAFNTKISTKSAITHVVGRNLEKWYRKLLVRP